MAQLNAHTFDGSRPGFARSFVRRLASWPARSGRLSALKTRVGDALQAVILVITATIRERWRTALRRPRAVTDRAASAGLRGRRLGPYILEQKLGEGGMGEVYKAHHDVLERTIAVKVIRSAVASEGMLARFAREARLTSRLSHDNTIHIYDYGVAADGTTYYAMEFVEGLSLWQLVKLDGPQSPFRVVAILARICAALANAHAKGIVHLDVKPDNVLLGMRDATTELVKLVDFGLARAVGHDDEVDDPNTVVGTAHYMAPEAIRQPWKVDARTDIYSVGALAYFLLTGTDVFDGAMDTVLARHVHAVPERPSSRLGAEIPADLERLIMRCLAKDPADRPQSAGALREALLLTECARTNSTEARAAAKRAAWWRAQPDLRTRLRAAAKSASRGSSSITATEQAVRRRRAVHV